MIINRQNYQIWITDYFDGQLDDFQTGVMMDFLSKNPDLMSEFEDYKELVLKPDDKEKHFVPELLRSPEQLTNEQVEHFSIALAENDLSQEEENDIINLSKSDPRFRENIRFYKSIKLQAENISYPDKSKLLRIPSRRKNIRLIINTVSAAASVAILAGIFALLNTNDNNNINTTAFNQSGQVNTTPAMNETEKVDLSENLVRYIPAKTSIELSNPVKIKEVPALQEKSKPERTLINISPLNLKSNIRIDNTHRHYLLAETSPYPEPVDPSSVDLSIREYLAYQFRKQVLEDPRPEIDRLKAYEIADAGIKGMNKLLGWEMQLETEKSEDGRLEHMRFTSELIKFGQKANDK